MNRSTCVLTINCSQTKVISFKHWSVRTAIFPVLQWMMLTQTDAKQFFLKTALALYNNILINLDLFLEIMQRKCILPYSQSVVSFSTPSQSVSRFVSQLTAHCVYWMVKTQYINAITKCFTRIYTSTGISLHSFRMMEYTNFVWNSLFVI